MATKIFSTKKNGQSKSTKLSLMKKSVIGILTIALIGAGSYGGYQYINGDTHKNTAASKPSRTESSRVASSSPFKSLIQSNSQKETPKLLSSSAKKSSKKIGDKKKSKKTAKLSKKKSSKKLAKNSKQKSKKSNNKKLVKHKKKSGKHLTKHTQGKKSKKTHTSKKHQKNVKKQVTTASR